MQNILSKHLEKIRDNSESESEKGRHFEKIAKLYLEKDVTQAYDKVWHYSQWAEKEGLPQRDTGIDLVARHSDGSGYCAIQCKFYDSKTRLNQNMLSSFIAHASSGKFASFVIVDTTTLAFSDNLEDLLASHELYSHRITISELDKSNIKWDKHIKEGITEIKDGKTPRKIQKKAIEAVITRFKTEDRGKMIMACGTGKTFTSLCIAEAMGEAAGKMVLYMVPSLPLMSQTVREWKYDASNEFNAFSVCSDGQVGRHTNDDVIDLRKSELAFPATTNAPKLAEKVKNAPKDKMIVIFATYQSIDVLTKAQKIHGMPAFDLIICDEAHRTTGAKEFGTEESRFVRIHKDEYVEGKKRLYMTATPKIFGDSAKAKAKEYQYDVTSMDDIDIFGKTFHTTDFASAVKANLLSDYKVIVLAVDEGLVSSGVQKRLAESDILTLDDKTKMIGCYKALTKRGLASKDLEDLVDKEEPNPMKRAVAFCRRINVSKEIVKKFPSLIDNYLNDETINDNKGRRLNIETEHVDGKDNSKIRDSRITWLADEPDTEDTCRILSNVRCLSEGVDVPALDAILFMHPRNSPIEVVQSVGRVMRKADGKDMGYVILPIVIRAGANPNATLDNDENYKVIWQILNALRTHDRGLDRKITQMRAGKDVSDKIEIMGLLKDSDGTAIEVNSINRKKEKEAAGIGGGDGGKRDDEVTIDIPKEKQLMLDVFDEFTRAIHAKILAKCGTRAYWGDDIDKIVDIYTTQITKIISKEGDDKTAFTQFLNKIKADINNKISQEEAIEMLVQHLITKPMFDALFKDSEFTKNNPVSIAMEVILAQLAKHNLEKETDRLKTFYEYVEDSVSEATTPAERQKLLLDIYEQFFSKAFSKMKQKLGIVYTPPAVVDFIIHSVNDVLKSEFKTTLGEKGVHILDPFTGTGTFITQMLESGLIKPEQMEHKYKHEIHANEIVLLAYYIAAINIESVYHDKAKEHANGTEVPYTPFNGVVLTDTFYLREEGDDIIAKEEDDNAGRRTKQKALDIRVIMGNPPYSVGQRSANDDAKNAGYPNLDKAIGNSYAKHSTATLKRSLYDSYIRAIRWATDRITEKGNDRGVVAYVSNGGWIDSNAMDGLRKCLVEEFSSLYIFHLRGNIRKNMATGGLAGEGQNIFGNKNMTGVAISVLVRNPDAKEFGKIYFHDIGDYLDQKAKLKKITEFKSINGITAEDGWQKIKPNKNYDWLNQRDPSFENYIAIGNKREKVAANIFTDYSRGIGSSRDAWLYNSSSKVVTNNMKNMIKFYNSEVERFANDGEGKNLDSFVDADPKKISWTRGLKNTLIRRKTTSFDPKKLVVAQYRPFLKQSLYFDSFTNEMVCQIPSIFPVTGEPNLAIAVNGVGSMKAFSALMINCAPDLEIISKSQCFPLKLYEAPNKDDMLKTDTPTYTKHDGISNKGLAHFQAAYPNETITKEDLFYYIYGLLHSPKYRKRFKNNLSRELPRIPAVKTFADFWAFSQAGRELGKLHVNYETEKPYNEVTIDYKKQPDSLIEDPAENAKFYHVKKMEFKGIGENKDKTIVRYNANITIKGIPLKAYEYIVNGKSALEWVMERQSVKTDKDSQIVNDANDYANETVGDPAYPLQLFQRVITVSLKTMEIITNLPDLDIA